MIYVSRLNSLDNLPSDVISAQAENNNIDSKDNRNNNKDSEPAQLGRSPEGPFSIADFGFLMESSADGFEEIVSPPVAPECSAVDSDARDKAEEVRSSVFIIGIEEGVLSSEFEIVLGSFVIRSGDEGVVYAFVDVILGDSHSHHSRGGAFSGEPGLSRVQAEVIEFSDVKPVQAVLI